MNNEIPTSETPTNGSAAEQPPAAIALTDADTGGSLTNADITALSRERQQTLLSILPPAVAAILITNRPPMPPHVEYEAHKRLVGALAKARGEIPSVPMDKTVDYVSKRTGERVHYSFASLDSISKSITEPLAKHGLVLECVFNDKTIVVLLSHEDGGIHLSWLPLPDEADIKDLATQITMRRRYLTVQLIAIVADEDTGERDIEEPKKPAGQRRGAQGQQRRTAAPVGGRGGGAAGRRQPQPGARPAEEPHRGAAGEAAQRRRRPAAGAVHRPERAAAAHHRGAEPPQRRDVRRRRIRAGSRSPRGRGAGPGGRRPETTDAQRRADREAHHRRHAAAEAQPRRAP